MKCTKCNGVNKVKNGKIKGVQRYLCKNCGYNFTVTQKSTSKSLAEKRMGIMMYLEGVCFQTIGRILGVSHVAVIKWIKKYGSQLEPLSNTQPVSIVELDEMHSYIGSKKKLAGYGLQLIEREKDIHGFRYWGQKYTIRKRIVEQNK